MQGRLLHAVLGPGSVTELPEVQHGAVPYLPEPCAGGLQQRRGQAHLLAGDGAPRRRGRGRQRGRRSGLLRAHAHEDHGPGAAGADPAPEGLRRRPQRGGAGLGHAQSSSPAGTRVRGALDQRGPRVARCLGLREHLQCGGAVRHRGRGGAQVRLRRPAPEGARRTARGAELPGQRAAGAGGERLGHRAPLRAPAPARGPDEHHLRPLRGGGALHELRLGVREWRPHHQARHGVRHLRRLLRELRELSGPIGSSAQPRGGLAMSALTTLTPTVTLRSLSVAPLRISFHSLRHVSVHSGAVC
mmetsp:Transcript_87461/g.271777  ORF Transcript_87461/g.271777 Transcript_87461/m.271777 type:complete len:301 (-) Transcript_87461:103-1005(-)